MIELSPELSRPGLYWRPGLVRLYLVVVCVWLSGFGYAAYDANRQFNRAQEFLHASDTERRMGHPITYDQADVATWLTDQTERRLLALWALPLFPIGAPVLYLVGMWILAHLVPCRRNENASETNRSQAPTAGNFETIAPMATRGETMNRAETPQKSAEISVQSLIAAKLRLLVPMTVIFMVGYIGLTVLAGFASGREAHRTGQPRLCADWAQLRDLLDTGDRL